VLIGTADVGGHDLQDDAMGSVLSAERIALALWHPQFRVADGFHFDGAWFDVSYSAITWHVFSPLSASFAATMPQRTTPSMQYRHDSVVSEVDIGCLTDLGEPALGKRSLTVAAL
jgi:hypothetical protein